MSIDIVKSRTKKFAHSFAAAYMDADIIKAWSVEVLAELIGRRRLSYEDIGQTVGKSKQAVWSQLTSGKVSEEMIGLLVRHFNIPEPSTEGPKPVATTSINLQGQDAPAQEEGVIVTRRLYETVLHDNAHLRNLSDRILKLLEQKLAG